MARKPSSDLSPYAYHRRVMDATEQKLAFRGGDVPSWQRKLRRKLRELLGEWPTERPPLNVRRLWKRDHELGSIEKIVFTSEPGADVPAYVCLPRDVEAPLPFFICVQGHSTGMHNSVAVDLETNKKPIEVEGDRDFGLGCLRRGVAALCIEQRAFGEREEKLLEKRIAANRCWDATMHALMLGRTLVGERVWDVESAIDYLYTRDDVDRRRIGVMGNSGGGTTSLFAAATLRRLDFAMPSCYFCSFRDSILSIGHCMDNYIPHLYRYAEMSDLLGLFAPRPVVVVAGEEDDIFPIKAVRAQFRKLKAIYKAAGAEKRCHLVVGKGGHRFYAEPAWRKMLAELKRGR